MWSEMRVGADVEVELQDTLGQPDIDLYEASVIKRHWGEGFTSVRYKGICRDDDSSVLLTEKVSTKFIRPCPPATPKGFEESLNVGCQVNVYDDEVCSWGIVTVRQIHRHANTGITGVLVEHHDVLVHKSGGYQLGPPNGVRQLVKTSSLRPWWDAIGGKWVNMTCLRASRNPLSTAPDPTEETPHLLDDRLEEGGELVVQEASAEHTLANSECRAIVYPSNASYLETRAQHLLARAAEKSHMVNMIMEDARQKCAELKNDAEAARTMAFSMLDAHGERVKQNLRAEDHRTTEALKRLHRHQMSAKRARLEDERKTAAIEAEIDALRAKALRTS